MTDLAAVLAREVSPDRLVGDLVAAARADVASVLGAVVARGRAVGLAEQVKRQLAEVDQVVKASVKEREALRVSVADLSEKVVRARGDLEVAQLQKQRALVGLGGDVVDLGAVEDQVRELERELQDTGSRLTTVSNRLRMRERDKAVLSDLLARLESVTVPDSAVLAVLAGALGH